eukprot:COSAG01_NODE_25299_length_749_cov_3.210769_1_plen_74_part_01
MLPALLADEVARAEDPLAGWPSATRPISFVLRVVTVLSAVAQLSRTHIIDHEAIRSVPHHVAVTDAYGSSDDRL